MELKTNEITSRHSRQLDGCLAAKLRSKNQIVCICSIHIELTKYFLLLELGIIYTIMKICHGCLVCRSLSRWFVVILIKTWADLLLIWILSTVNSIKTRRLWRKLVLTLFIERLAGFISRRIDFSVDWSESVKPDYSDVYPGTPEYKRQWNADCKGGVREENLREVWITRFVNIRYR